MEDQITIEQKQAKSEERTFPNLLQALDYLHAGGWKISQPGIYKHKGEGKIRPNAAGVFTKAMIDRYAKTFLKKVDGSKRYSEELDVLQRQKVTAETRRAQAQAEREERRNLIEREAYVPRESLELELAARASVLKSDDDNWIYATAGQIITQVKGDPALEPDLIEFLRSSREGIFARYSDKMATFTVDLPVPVADLDSGADSADDDSEVV